MYLTIISKYIKLMLETQIIKRVDFSQIDEASKRNPYYMVDADSPIIIIVDTHKYIIILSNNFGFYLKGFGVIIFIIP